MHAVWIVFLGFSYSFRVFHMVDIAVETPVSFQKLADRLEVCDKTVHNWARHGLEFIQLGGRYFTSYEAVQRFGSKSTAPSTAPVTAARRSVPASRTKRDLSRRHGIDIPGGCPTNN